MFLTPLPAIAHAAPRSAHAFALLLPWLLPPTPLATPSYSLPTPSRAGLSGDAPFQGWKRHLVRLQLGSDYTQVLRF